MLSIEPKVLVGDESIETGQNMGHCGYWTVASRKRARLLALSVITTFVGLRRWKPEGKVEQTRAERRPSKVDPSEKFASVFVDRHWLLTGRDAHKQSSHLSQPQIHFLHGVYLLVLSRQTNPIPLSNSPLFG